MSDEINKGIDSEESFHRVELTQSDTTSAEDQVSKQDPRFEAGANSPPDKRGNRFDHVELNNLGMSHFRRFQSNGDINELNKAIEYKTRALDLTPKDHPDLPLRHGNLGVYLTGRFRRLGEIGDIEKALQHLTCAIHLTPDGRPDLPGRHNDLGLTYRERFQSVGDVNDIEKAVEHINHALDLTPNGHPDLPQRHSSLGSCHMDRFRRIGDITDIAKTKEHYSHALDLTPSGHPDLPERHNSLGWTYTERFRRVGDMNDLEQAIEHFTRALDLTPDGHPNLPDRHYSLGASYIDRFRRVGDLKELVKALEHFTHALDLTPHGHPDLPERHDALGWSYTERFRRVGDINDIGKAVEHITHALDLTPSAHPELPARYTSLGLAYTVRFQRLGDVNDIEQAIEIYTHALDLTPDGHSAFSDRQTFLGASYIQRFERVGDLNDIEQAIKHYTHALDLTPSGHPDLPERHNSLGWSHIHRFRRVGDMNDLEKAIEHFVRALDLTPDGHPDLPDRLNDLGWFYTERFRRLRDINDIGKAVGYITHALDLTPSGHPALPRRYNLLGASSAERFRLTGVLNDLEIAIEHISRALELTPDGHPDLPGRLNDLAWLYVERFRRVGDTNDIEQAIEHFNRALDLTPDGHPSLPKRHSSLGVSYTDRFRCVGDMNDLEKAIEQVTRALGLTPDGHPDLTDRYFELAVSHALRYERVHDPSHLHHSLSLFRQSSQLTTGPPRTRFQHALEWTRYASRHPELNCLEAYQTAIELLPQLIWLGVTTAQRYTDLLEAKNLAVNATSAAIRHGNPGLAFEWLEHTRCVVWNQTAMLRSPLDELQSSHPDLATRLRAVSTQLHDAGSGNLSPEMPALSSADQEQIGKHRRRLAMEYSDLVAKARALPGFKDFLQPMSSDGLIRAAKHGPIVAINCHTDQCDALIITPKRGDVLHLPLPNFTENKARSTRSDLEASLSHMGVRQRGIRLLNQPAFEDRIPSVLLCLWTDIVKPVLDFLGFINNAPVDNLPHITWCPTGALSFLPLHAAGDYDQPRSRVFDYAISSYTPTITALLSSTPETPTHPLRVLAVGQASTPGHAPLPGTTVELACLKNHSQAQAELEYSTLIDNQATTTAVLDAMEQHDWMHLACHAHQNIVDPTKSGFFLHNGILDLASISRRSFKNKGLAFLSACQTATGDEKLPDEAIHLASGMLMAGYPSVIATMWSVVDADAPVVADKVYAELMKEGKVGGGEAGKALHDAIAILRDRVGEKKFGRWVPYIHIGS